MKVAQIVTSIGYESSGPSYSVPGLARGLVAAGVDASVHTLEPEIQDRRVPIIYYRRNKVPFLRHLGISTDMWRGLKRIAGEYDIFHSNGLWMCPNVYPAWSLRLASVKRSCKLVTAPRGALADWCLRRSRVVKKIFGVAVQYAAMGWTDMWHATCEKEYMEIRGQGYKQPVAIVPIGMDLPKIDSKDIAIGIRKKKDLRRVAFFGRIHDVKCVDRLVLAWSRICKYYPNWELAIAGPDCGGMASVNSIIQREKTPRVSFWGELHGNDKYRFLQNADVYVLPSHTENFAITVAEALACGIPCIASKGSPWRCIDDEGAGWWVSNDVHTLSSVMYAALAKSPEELQRMGERGRKMIERDFSWTGVGIKMKSAYDWILGNADRPDWVKID